MLKDICTILGWQGGTIHQAIKEIKRLKAIEYTTKELMNELALMANIGKFKPNTGTENALHNVNTAFRSQEANNDYSTLAPNHSQRS